MAKKAGPGHKQRPARGRGAGERVARRLIMLASQVVQDPEGTDDQFDQLAELIEQQLEAGRDRVIQKALEQAPDAAVYEELLDDVLAAIEWQTVIGADEELMDLILFAVPLQLALYAPAQPRTVPVTLSNIDVLVKSFRQHGLVGAAPTVVLQNYLYSFDELGALPFSRRYALPLRMLEAMQRSGWADLFQSQEPPVELPPGEAHILMRFMLGLVVQTPDDPQPFIGEEEDDEALAERGLAWMDAIAREVERQLAEANLEALCVPSFPAPLQSALQEGYQQHREFALQIALNQTLEQGSDPTLLYALLALPSPATEEAVLITLADRNTEQPRLRYAWQPAPWDDPAEVLDSIQTILTQAGIQDIRIDDTPAGPASYLH